MVLEKTSVADFFAGPTHPYARALLAATPKYTDPDGSLLPVPDAVIASVQAELARADIAGPGAGQTGGRDD